MNQNGMSTSSDASCLLKIKSIYPDLRESEKKVGDYIMSNAEFILSKPLLEMSREIGVSEASIVRFCKQIGYSGYSELKLMLAMDLGERNRNDNLEVYDVNITKEDKLENIPQKVINRTIQALEDTSKIFSNEEYLKAVEVISKSKRIDVYGVANSASVADDFMNKFIRIGIKCNVYADSHLQLMSAVNLKKGDVALGISHSGKTKDTVDALKEAQKAGATTICITNYSASLISEFSDIKLLTANYETDFFSETMVSRISQLAIVDMLFLGVVLRNYSKYTKIISDINRALIHKTY